uniref:Methyltransferase domain-containing protein n=1 Tax=Ciona savignyi TaxID=51511 RepID=H2YWU1_CIOSA
IDGNLVTLSENIFMYKNSAQAIFLLSSFCGKLGVNLCLVTNSSSTKIANFGFVVPSAIFSDVKTISIQNLPDAVGACVLPCVSVNHGLKIISGLCHVLRYILKFKIKNHDDSKFLKGLLGHKQCCLKASSEISSRTNLCEVLAPQIIDHWLPSYDSDIPPPILQFEGHMRKPIVIHNMDKMQRIVLERLEAKDIVTKEPPNKKIKARKRVIKTNDLPPLEHVFTEGVEFMISDLALLPCMHSFIQLSGHKLCDLKLSLPLTLLWYHRLHSIDDVVKAASNCGVKLIPVSEFVGHKKTNFENGTYQLDITLRRDLPGIIVKVNELVNIKFENLERKCIELQWETFPSSVHPTQGELSLARASRKCHQIENIVGAVMETCKKDDVIVDFCSGGGHVGIVLAYLLPSCKVILVENKEESLDRAYQRIQTLKLKNIMLYQCNLDQFSKDFDIGIALHACGVATDMVLQKCISNHASFVISPCCYGKIQNTATLTYPQSSMFKNSLISYEQLVLLGHGGDQTSWNFESEKSKQGKHCMGLVDSDRCHFATESNYRTKMYTMLPTNCSPKNNLIVGVLK